MLEKKQDEELQKDLSDLQKGVALDKVIAEEKVKAKFKDLKDEVGICGKNQVDKISRRRSKKIEAVQCGWTSAW